MSEASQLNQFELSLSPIKLGPITIRNRYFASGYETGWSKYNEISEELLAYTEERARGGTPLIITQALGVHGATNYYDGRLPMLDEPSLAGGLRKLAEACHRHDTRIFGQLFHVGRYAHAARNHGPPIAYGPSAIPAELTRAIPIELTREQISEIVAAYAEGACTLRDAGFDGIEVMASHGYLPAQFLNQNTNTRADEYGGDLPGRIRFLEEVLVAVRNAVGPNLVVGIRISGDETDYNGMQPAEVADICARLDARDMVDYFNVSVGSEATARGNLYYIPPMSVSHGYSAPVSRKIKSVVRRPVMVVGRINQPQIAEEIIARGDADMCGMARALICDPEFVGKTSEGRHEEIRACIGCNQACVGHYLRGLPISCIQNPLSGRELRYRDSRPAKSKRKVVVVGGGPGGMKAAAIAAERGHDVTLFERSGQLGGQALLAQLLPGRSEFGGIVQNLAREVRRAGVRVNLNTEVTREMVLFENPSAVIVATGSRSWIPELEGSGLFLEPRSILTGEVSPGKNVLVADSRGDWIAPGIAELLATRGHNVTLATTGMYLCDTLDMYTRAFAIGQMFRHGIKVLPNLRIFGAESGWAYLQHTITNEPLQIDSVDTVVVVAPAQPRNALAQELKGLDASVQAIGDCLAPRTAEQAVLEGFEAAHAL